MSGENQKELRLKLKYAELPDELKYTKKKPKKKAKKANHKHTYVPCYFNNNTYVYKKGEKIPMYGSGMYCSICGRIGDTGFNQVPIAEADPYIPIFKRDLLDMNKYVAI